MPHLIELPDDIFEKLQSHAVPLVDTPATVIARALNALEAGDEDPAEGSSSQARTFNPAAPPDLSFTNVHEAKIGGKVLRRSEANWNSIMLGTIAEAGLRGHQSQDILDLITVNSQLGRKEGGGFKYVEEADISIQGQNANNAWRVTYILASSFGIEVGVTFSWPANPKAARPSEDGSLFMEGD